MSLKISTDIFFDGIGYFCVEKIQGLSAVVCQVIAGIVMGGFGSDQICLQKTGDRFLYREIICIFFFQNKICDLCVSQRIFCLLYTSMLLRWQPEWQTDLVMVITQKQL